jgi:hypothetical protein
VRSTATVACSANVLARISAAEGSADQSATGGCDVEDQRAALAGAPAAQTAWSPASGISVSPGRAWARDDPKVPDSVIACTSSSTRPDRE